MAVRSTTAHDAAQRPALLGPIRTCVGCRKRSAAAELLRVVVAPGSASRAEHPDQVTAVQSTARGSAAVLVVPDPRRRAPGRGAWLHPEPRCVDLAQRRRAFHRALRVSGELDPTPVREYVEASR